MLASNGPAAAQGDQGLSDAERHRANCFLAVAEERYAAAILACDAAIEADSTDPEPYSNRGSASLFLQFPLEAVKDFTIAIRLAPADARNYFNRGIAFEAINLPSQAQSDYDTAIQLKPDMAAAFYNRAQLLRKTGRTDEAIADYRRAAELDPQYKAMVAAALAKLGELL